MRRSVLIAMVLAAGCGGGTPTKSTTTSDNGGGGGGDPAQFCSYYANDEHQRELIAAYCAANSDRCCDGAGSFVQWTCNNVTYQDWYGKRCSGAPAAGSAASSER